MTPSLSLTFEPPRITTNGRARVGHDRAEDRRLLVHEASGRVRQEPGHVGDGGLVAVHDTEAVGHVDVSERRELGRERLPLLGHLAGLACVEPDVLQQDDVAGLLGCHHGSRVGERHERHGGAQQLAQASRHGSQAQLGNGGSLGPTQVRHDDDPGALVAQVGQRGQGRLDASVIGDDTVSGRTVGQGDVEVRPDQNGPPGDLEVVERLHAYLRASSRRGRRGRRGGCCSPTRCRTSRRPSPCCRSRRSGPSRRCTTRDR